MVWESETMSHASAILRVVAAVDSARHSAANARDAARPPFMYVAYI